MRRYGRVVLGGTFDRLHAGHEALLRTAFQAGRTVAIGLTSATFLRGHPKPRREAIRSERARRAGLERWLRARYPRRRWTVVRIDDRFGGSVEGGVDALVVSADTVPGGLAVNRERRRRGRDPVPLVVVPLLLADDLEPLSSRRIRAGEVDREGHRRRPLSLGLYVAQRDDLPAVRRAVRRAFPRPRIVESRGPSLRRPTPALLRRLALRARGARNLGLAVARSGRIGRLVALAGRTASLDPRRLVGRSPRELEDSLAHLLRPSPPKRL